MFDNFCIPRASCGSFVTTLGRRLIEFSNVYGLYIVNGRVGQDKNIRNYTYIGPQGCSVIDYVLSSAKLFTKFKNLLLIQEQNHNTCL